MPIIQLYFLGVLEIRLGDRTLPKPPTLKSQALLAYLISHRHQPHPRERLAELFWSGRPEYKARSSLSTSLWHIRRCFPNEELIISDTHTVQFNPLAEVWLDIDEFQSLVSFDDEQSLESAEALYKGDFLDGFYDDWIINVRYRLEGLLFDVLSRLITIYESEGDHKAALQKALRLIDLDPLREDAHRAAMRAYSMMGQRNDALEQYKRCCEVVGEELGIEPSTETIKLNNEIMQADFEFEHVSAAIQIQPPSMKTPSALGRNPLDAATQTELVGRDKEIAFLDGRWQRAKLGQGGLILISGEAGVGKTRLVNEFADRLSWQQARVLLGRCYEFESILPYQPIVEALRTFIQNITSTELVDIPPWVVEELVPLIPDIEEKYPDLVVSSTISPDKDKSCLFEGVSRFLKEFSSQEALLIILEDLHWASDSTLQLIHHLAHQVNKLPILIVGTFRPEALRQDQILRDIHRRLEREKKAHSLKLLRLPLNAVEIIVVGMSGIGGKVLPLAHRLYQETEGNPFFLMETIKALFESGTLYMEGDSWKGDFTEISKGEFPMPSGVSEIIQARVSNLKDDVLEALQQAAVLGRAFNFDSLNAVWDEGEESTLVTLDTLLRRRILEEGTGAEEHDYTFTHHKIQEVIYLKIPYRHRQYAHAQTGAALERLFDTRLEEFAGELAFHFREAALLDKSLQKKAIQYLLLAGDQARALYALKEAIDYYELALEIMEETGDYRQAARILMKLGLTHHNALDFDNARLAYERGFTLWQQSGENKIRESAQLPPAPHSLRVAWFDPVTLDPTLAYDTESYFVIIHLFSPLMEMSPSMEVIPDVAQNWQVVEGGRKYIFHLRDDIRWSDGHPLTAKDYEYTFKRILNPSVDSFNARLLYCVKGARFFNQGESEENDIGVFSPDDSTLIVELEEPAGYFLQLLTIIFPVPRHIVEEYGNAWAEPGNIVTNGPFRVDSWHPGRRMVLERRNDYHRQVRGNIRRVELSLISDFSAAIDLYSNGELDVLDATYSLTVELEKVRHMHAGEYITGPLLMTSYAGFNVQRAPFNDRKVRQALVHAVDRKVLANVNLRGSVNPATGGFISPGMPGHSPGIGLPYDPKRARQLLTKAGYPGGRDFPAVRALTRRGNDILSSYIQEQWRENLGVEIAWESLERSQFLEILERNPPHIFIINWVADYPDPDNYMRVSPATWRYTCWSNERFKHLVKEAIRLNDQSERMQLYKQADRILVEEAPILPLTYGRAHLLVKPWVSQYQISQIGWYDWKNVTIEPH